MQGGAFTILPADGNRQPPDHALLLHDPERSDQLALFGGTGLSGVGRELSNWFLDTFTESKLLAIDLGDAPKGDRMVMPRQ